MKLNNLQVLICHKAPPTNIFHFNQPKMASFFPCVNEENLQSSHA